MTERIYIEGNDGANWVEIAKVDDNRLRLKLGDCCINSVDVILTAEVMSNALTHLADINNESLIEEFENLLEWNDENKDKFLKNCENMII